jgi:hypothetical protein
VVPGRVKILEVNRLAVAAAAASNSEPPDV